MDFERVVTKQPQLKLPTVQEQAFVTLPPLLTFIQSPYSAIHQLGIQNSKYSKYPGSYFFDRYS